MVEIGWRVEGGVGEVEVILEVIHVKVHVVVEQGEVMLVIHVVQGVVEQGEVMLVIHVVKERAELELVQRLV
jgi:hypothetical protein